MGPRDKAGAKRGKRTLDFRTGRDCDVLKKKHESETGQRLESPRRSPLHKGAATVTAC